jgi:lipoprotein-anchoring transpeptidase ErfK/SrfK
MTPLPPQSLAPLLAAALGLLAGCASSPPEGADSRPGGIAHTVPGQPVTLPGIQDPTAAPRPRTGTTDLRQRKARPAQVRRAQPTLAQAFWRDDASTGGKRRVVISLSHQVAQVWENSTLIAQSPVSTGREGYHTPPGAYTIVDKRREHHSSLYGEFIDASGKHVGLARAGQKPPPGTRYVPSPMPYFMRMTWTGLGMHQGYLPGWPASHGCIRLPPAMAKRFFEELPKGTPVEIIP